MEFGFFAQGAVPAPLAEGNPGLEHQRLMESVEIAVRSEAWGFKYAWASEHHFLTEYSHMASPEVFAAFVAARTTTLHVGSAITNTTPAVNHPVRVAEQVATLDHLTEGRYEFGTGRGSSTTEMGGFGVTDWDSTRDMWAETLREFPKMWASSSYHHDGTYFSVPERNVVPKLYRKTPPPMWVAAGNPETFEIAAANGLGVLCFAFGPPAKSKIPAAAAAYKAAIGDCDPVTGYANDNILCVTNLVCCENRDDAFKLAASIGMSYYHSQVLRWLDTFPRPKGVPAWPELIPEPTPDEVERLAATGAIIAGDPDDCAKGVEIYRDLGIDQLVFSPLTTQMSLEDALASFELFGTEVIPRFDTDPVHRTARLRDAAES
ncbi:LLM class flavin-dependent oxidoreductase [Rhabdothermincola sediminis]|uniref:LLM class flavin-dependent oxidoreductase n=1 Tax=Rhabdothermincola sediminis TaxID=2751370 RepID=UPI001AA01446|nr:LLM class flavin-dependent oxidoreductase [Rhabdothermincola sediminis]